MRFWAAIAALALLVVPAAEGASRNGHWNPEEMYYANAYADHYHVPRELVHAIITQESGWNPSAHSSAGALGLMQLMPGTALRFAVGNPVSIEGNVGGGVRYLAALSRIFVGDLRLVVAAYYCGERHIEQLGLEYSNPEVIRYVRSVETLYRVELKLHHSNQKGN
jgi:soluble lytic murein transglycosylase-like protein